MAETTRPVHHQCFSCGSQWWSFAVEVHHEHCPVGKAQVEAALAQRQRERAAYAWRQTAEPVLRDALATLDRQGFGCAAHPCSLPLCNLAERIRALLEAEHDQP